MNGLWTLDRLTAALDDELAAARPGGTAALGAICTDTRALQSGDIFVALRGERFDGHDFIAQAVAAGAAALVVSDARRAVGAGVPVFVVADTTRALGTLARWWRRQWRGTVIAVAGSNGKTGTKEMLASVLGRRFRVHATQGNLNNHIGVPLTLLALPPDAEVAVVEIGTNHPGEVATLRDIAEPDLAVITSIGEEHLEGFGTLDGVLHEEASIALGVSTVIGPAEPPALGDAVRRHGAAFTSVGLDAGDVRPVAWGLGDDGRGWLTLEGGAGPVSLPVVGEHHLRNALLAVVAGRRAGLDDATIGQGLAATPAPAMRSQWRVLGRLRVLDDAYNANPASARAALAAFDTLATTGSAAVVLGSMLELGAQSDTLHDEIARRALATRASVIGAVGAFAAAFHRVAPQDPRVVAADDVVALWPLLAPRLTPDALVLLKGSRGTRLERLLPLLADFAGVPFMPASAH